MLDFKSDDGAACHTLEWMMYVCWTIAWVISILYIGIEDEAVCHPLEWIMELYSEHYKDDGAVCWIKE